jgi:hypothetical protein
MAKRFKLNKNQLIVGAFGAAVGIGLYLWLTGQKFAFQGEEYMGEAGYFGGEGTDYESGLFVSYDDGFTVGNRVLVS